MAIHPEKKKEPSQFSNGWIGRIQIRRNIQSHVCHGEKKLGVFLQVLLWE